jgi:alpha-ketoglutarate-dependent taurine dioxygenase
VSLTIQKLDPIGALITDPDLDYLLHHPDAGAELTKALDDNSVLLVRGLHLDDETQLAVARRMGEIVVKHTPGWSKETPGIYRIALDPEANDELYVKGSWDWHIDGATANGIPPKATMLTCRGVPGAGGETQALSTYIAYDQLSTAEKDKLAGLKVWHKVRPDAYTEKINLTPAQSERLATEAANLHPLVWTHLNGRKSLVLGITADRIEGLPAAESDAILDDLNARAAAPENVLTHTWQLDDLLIWDNTGTMHRGRPYTETSGRDMHRCTIVGYEPIQ